METGEGGDKTETEVLGTTCGGFLTVKGWSTITTGQKGRADTAMGPQWLTDIEAGPRIRGREIVQSQRTPQPASTRQRISHMREPAHTCGLPDRQKSLLGRSLKGCKNFQSKSSVLIVANHTRKSRTLDSWNHFPTKPSCTISIQIGPRLRQLGSTQTAQLDWQLLATWMKHWEHSKDPQPTTLNPWECCPKTQVGQGYPTFSGNTRNIPWPRLYCCTKILKAPAVQRK